MTILDSSAAWTGATRMVAANRDLLMAIAGVFFFLPGLAVTVFAPSPVMAPDMTETQMLKVMQDYYASSWPVLLILSVPPMAGMLTMLGVMLDDSRPTVSQAIRRSMAVLPPYFATQLLIALAILVMATVSSSVLALMIPARLAISASLGLLLYPIMLTMLVGPVMASNAEHNPMKALRASIRLTSGNAARLSLFIGLAGFLFLIIYGLIMMFVGIVLVLLFRGEPQRLLDEGVSGALWALGYTYLVAMLAAVYRQLAGPVPGTTTA